MDANRFDTISKLFASRKNRRTAIGGGLGIVAAAAGGRALAQDATPAPEEDTVHPDAVGGKGSELFTQAFASGTWESDGSGGHTLTLTGVPAQTVYFADRPERYFGMVAMDQFITALDSEPTDPPNAALITGTEADGEDILIVELSNPQYDTATSTLTYSATVLTDYQQDGLSQTAIRQQDFDFPASFDQGGLFIDSFCGQTQVDCYHNDTDAYVGKTGWVGECFSLKHRQCYPCHHMRYDCGHAFPDPCAQHANGWWPCYGEMA